MVKGNNFNLPLLLLPSSLFSKLFFLLFTAILSIHFFECFELHTKKNRDLSLKIIVNHLLTAQITLPFDFIENKLETTCLTKD